MTALDKIVYTAHAHATGGRDGHAQSEDGQLDIKLAPPKEMGGSGDGLNPEQLFAAGYAACFLGAVKFVAKEENATVPDDARVDAAVSIGPITGGFGLAVALKVALPGMERDMAQKLIDTAHERVCPYSNATRGNIDVQVSLA